jgi:hypothetical protein
MNSNFQEDTHQGATGLIVRDHEGHLIQGQALWYDNAASALIMEAQALRDGLRLALDRNYQ